ncbi:TPA: O81 family O-antigen flippase [Vibrio vulnificus]|nr:O81 family O-antigen flippase [Vibrio vulnificus]HAS8510761.1 O81 family O-antigen flippase [Vibrio vulnificus]
MNYFRINQLALLSLFSSSFKVLVGPITLLFLAKTLSSEELGFYYAFFSLVAMKQLLEVGMTNVLKQFYSYQSNSPFNVGSRKKINDYFIFSIKWYLILAFIFSILSIFIGYVFFYDYSGSVDWKGSWYLLIFGSFFSLLIMPLQSYLDGSQYQKELQKYNIVSQLCGTCVLWLSLYFGLSLFSIGMSTLVTSFSFVLCVFFNRVNIFKFSFTTRNFKFRSVFFELWPLLKRTSLVWFLGYFYWNGFNIIAFKYLGPISAGIIGLSLSLGRAGLNIAISIVISHMTIYAKDIANEKYDSAYDAFKKNSLSGFVILLLGYSVFLIAQLSFESFYFFSKVLKIEEIMWMFMFFVLSYVISSMDNFTRCYKVEKFVFIQFVNSIITPLSFFLSIYAGFPYFSGPAMSLVLIMIMTFSVFKEIVRN